MKLLRNIGKLGAAEEKKTKCDIFGELIAAELKTLNQIQLVVAKHEIQNVLFKLRLQGFSECERSSGSKVAPIVMSSHAMSPPVMSSATVSYPAVASPSYQFQPHQCDGLGIDPLTSFTTQLRDAASNNV